MQNIAGSKEISKNGKRSICVEIVPSNNISTLVLVVLRPPSWKMATNFHNFDYISLIVGKSEKIFEHKLKNIKRCIFLVSVHFFMSPTVVEKTSHQFCQKFNLVQPNFPQLCSIIFTFFLFLSYSWALLQHVGKIVKLPFLKIFPPKTVVRIVKISPRWRAQLRCTGQAILLPLHLLSCFQKLFSGRADFSLLWLDYHLSLNFSISATK